MQPPLFLYMKVGVQPIGESRVASPSDEKSRSDVGRVRMTKLSTQLYSISQDDKPGYVVG